MAQEATQTPESGQTPPEGQQTTPETPQEGQGTPKTFDEDYVKSLRAEAAKHRKEAADTKARLQALEDAKLSETEKLQKQAEEGKQLAEQATGKLRQANLRDAIAEKGFTGPQAKAVARLLDSIEYDDSDEPTNLDARLEAAAGEYGDLVKPNGGQTVTFDGGVRPPAPVNKSAEDAHHDFIGALLTGRDPTRSH